MRAAGQSGPGDRDVFMRGAYTAQHALKAGVLDAIEIPLRPVLLGQGRRLFDDLPAEHIELELVRALRAPATMHLRYRMRDSVRSRCRQLDLRTCAYSTAVSSSRVWPTCAQSPFQDDLLALVLGPDGGATMRRDDTAEDALGRAVQRR